MHRDACAVILHFHLRLFNLTQREKPFPSGNMSTATHFVTYLISCTVCKVQYVGCTQQRLKARFRRHISDMHFADTKIVSAVSKHCFTKHQGISAFLHIQGIERVTSASRGGDLKRKLQNRESYWILVLGTRAPTGLNSRQDLILCY